MAAPAWPPSPTTEGLYLYQFDETSAPRVARFKANRWLEIGGPNHGRVLDRPQLWSPIPHISQWMRAPGSVAA